jgi:hypothetical protein
VIEVLFGALVGAVGFRLRGSDLFEQITGYGTTVARIVCWAIPMALLSLFHVPWEYIVVVGAAFYLGAIFPWWGCIDLGHNDGSALRDYIVMFFRGLIWTVPAGLVVYQFDANAGLILALSGALCPLAYTIGWATPSKAPNLNQGPELGEFIFGAIVGAAVVL